MSKKTIGLALSGGGYRAAGFHLGTLRALNKLGVLPNIDRFSTISGGSPEPVMGLMTSLMRILKLTWLTNSVAKA